MYTIAPQFAMRRLKNPKVTLVSLVSRPKTGLRAIVKSDGTFEYPALIKADGERGEILALVYPAERPDADDDIASADVVREMAHSHARTGLALDVQHDGKPLSKSQAFVAESFIVQPGDPRFSGWKDSEGNDVDAAGGWAQVIRLEDPVLRKAFKDGTLSGVSLFGTAQREPVGDPRSVFKALKSLFLREEEPPAMTESQIAEIVAKSNKPLLEAIEGLVKQIKPAAPAAPDASDGPVFKGDPDSLEDLLAFQREIEKAEITKGLSSQDPSVRAKALEKAKQRLATAAGNPAPSNAPTPASDVKKGEAAPDPMDFFKRPQ